MLEANLLGVRPERSETVASAQNVSIRGRPLTAWEWLSENGAVRKTAVIVALALIWEVYARLLGNPLMVPTLTDTIQALFRSLFSGNLPGRIYNSLYVLLLGYGAGVLIAAFFTILAISTRIGTDLLEVLTAMFNPLPSIALLPLALIWFGLGTPSLAFVLIHAVLWAVALNAHSGFRSVSLTLRMVGRNCGMRGIRYIAYILIPAAFPNILTGLKIAWAFAWRTLIAAEMVFGASGGQGGLGWFIFENKNQLNTAEVFAGLLCVILIGLIVENLVFRVIEHRTIRRWGMEL